MREPKYKSSKVPYYYHQNSGSHKGINYEKNLNQAQKLYSPNYNYNNNNYKNKNYNYNYKSSPYNSN